MSRPDRARWLVYGPSGVGKTTFGADFHSAQGEALSLYAAPPHNHQAVRDRAHLVANSLDDFRALVAGADFKSYDSVVVDDIQSLFEWLVDDIAKKAGTPFEELTFGRNWRPLRMELMLLLDTIVRRGAKNIVVISKETNLTKLNGTNVELIRTKPSIVPNLWEPLQGDFDMVLYAQPGPPSPTGTKNTATLTGTTKREAKNRWAGQLMLPDPMPLEGRAVYDAFYSADWKPRNTTTEVKKQ